MKREQIQAPKGVSEYVPPRSASFEWIRDQLIAPAKSAGYQLMELPVFEDTNLFSRGVGESTDVVSKEMYTFEDRGGRSITLRPEGTAGVMRAVIEHSLDRGQLPVKVFYSGAYFRAERPQAGRYRQFYQVGVESIGLDDPAIDAEIIALADTAFKNIGLKKYRLEITSLGDAESRAAHKVDLVAFLKTLDLDEATQARAEFNPLRLFDDKREEIRSKMASAPLLMDYLSDSSRENFAQVCSYLDALGITYTLNTRMVRGLDYYTGTTFEFVHRGLGAQSGIGGGGRYDGLMEVLGGQELSGIGFGLGIDRTLLACEAEGIDLTKTSRPDLYVIPLGESAKNFAIKFIDGLRNGGAIVDCAYGDRALKGAMKGADKSGAKYALVIGESELSSGVGELKNMETGVAASVTLSTINSALLK